MMIPILAVWPDQLAAAFETAAPTAILIDYETGAVLFEKNADERVEPASLSKLMTVAVIFDRLKSGEIKLTDRYRVSEHAWRTGGASSGGSTMFLPLNSEVTLDDLIKGIIIQSGNDATIVAAEGIAGSEPAFAELMNQEAARIGMTGSHFANASGLPDPGQYSTMRDLSKLAAYIIREFPDHYPLFSEEVFAFNGITQRNRNPLLGLGADGLKTGHTQAAGYGLVASAKNDAGRRIVLAMSKMTSTEERAREARALMTFGLQDLEEVVVFRAGDILGNAPVRGGVAPHVPLTATEDFRFLAPRGTGEEVRQVVIDNGPVEAPVAKGQRLGWVEVKRGEETIRAFPLYATLDVERANLFERIADTVADHFR